MSWGAVVIAGATIVSAEMANDSAEDQAAANNQAISEMQQILNESMQQELAYLAEGNAAAASHIRAAAAEQIAALTEVIEMTPELKAEVQAIAGQWFEESRQVYEPFLADKPAANRAFNQQLAMLGLPNIDGSPNAFNPEIITSRPSYKFVKEETMRGQDRSAAARLGSLGGRAVVEAGRRAGGLASQEFNNEFARVGNVANALNRSAQFGAQGTSNAAQAAAGQVLNSYNQLNGHLLSAIAGIGEAGAGAEMGMANLAMQNAGSLVQISQNNTNSQASLLGARTNNQNALTAANASRDAAVVESIGTAAGDIFGSRRTTNKRHPDGYGP